MREPCWEPLYPEKVASLIEHSFHDLRLIEIPFMYFDRAVNGYCTGVSLTFSVLRYLGLTKQDLFELAIALQKHMEKYNPTVDEIWRYMVDETASICYFTSMPYENTHNIVIPYPKRFLKRISSGNIYAPPYNPGDIINFLESEVV